MAFDFPSSPSSGTSYVTSSGEYYIYDGSGWTTLASQVSPNVYSVNPFKYRTIYTRGYTSAGYASSTPWRNVNRTQHSTDITTNLGDMIDYAASYIDGSFSDYYHYVYGDSGAVGGTSVWTSSINMSTEAARTHSASWDTKTSRRDCVSLLNATLTVCYITVGSSSATDKHNLVTEIMYAAGTAPANPIGVGGTNGAASAFYGEFYGWINFSSTSAALNWKTETWSSGGLTFAGASDGQPKGLSSKHGFGYCSIGSYAATAQYYKYNDVTGGSSVATISRPESCGEENCQIGQNWGYTLGAYNGASQNNNSTKTNYLTDTCVAMGADTQPKGHAGMSSGCCASAAASVLGGY
jgi:hypothetical protein